MLIIDKIRDGLSGSSHKSFSWEPGQTRTRVMAGSARATALLYEVNVLVLLDRSGSMPRRALEYMFGTGFDAIASALHQAGKEQGLRYNLCIKAFSSDCETILPFTSVESDCFKSLCMLPPQGVTCLEKALSNSFDEIDFVKASQDRERIPRQGSVLVVVTDGKPTDDKGHLQPLSNAMVDEISQRSKSRKTQMVAFGFGDADGGTLKQLAPAVTVRMDNGVERSFAHAIRYNDPSYESAECWKMLAKLVARASSNVAGARGGVGGTAVFVNAGDGSSFYDESIEAIELPPEYVVVG